MQLKALYSTYVDADITQLQKEHLYVSPEGHPAEFIEDYALKDAINLLRLLKQIGADKELREFATRNFPDMGLQAIPGFYVFTPDVPLGLAHLVAGTGYYDYSAYFSIKNGVSHLIDPPIDMEVSEEDLSRHSIIKMGKSIVTIITRDLQDQNVEQLEATSYRDAGWTKPCRIRAHYFSVGFPDDSSHPYKGRFCLIGAPCKALSEHVKTFITGLDHRYIN
ncbi:hypothetical protein [Entomobacter blattae]|uniref:Uncharacterized protein n=1 Tax=Entomobacter blattae TaxID=2762277 RepID=A0A7H1NRB0_9PROT|nr:hypothetical protein [Entomobacter blattae]QNT78320.1 hypothetical protein JGUZn3_10920 [Entomobacter blattae]